MLSTGIVRAATLTGFTELLAEYGYDHRVLFGELGLEADFLDLPDVYIPFESYCQLMEAAAQLTQAPEFGLVLGKRQSVGILGAFGFAMQQSTTVKAALQLFQRYYHTHNPSATLLNHIQDGIVQLSSDSLVAMPPSYKQARFKTISVTTSILRALCGDDWKPIEIWFNFPYQGNRQIFERLLEAPVSFDQPVTSIFYDAKFIDRNIPNHDPSLRKILTNYLQLIEFENQGDFTSIVYATIKSSLLTEHCNKSNVANFLGMSSRTLQRKLARQGSSFKGLLTQARIEAAKHYLIGTDFTVTQISELLGYSELSVFSRAFKIWVGESPLVWRDKELSAKS